MGTAELSDFDMLPAQPVVSVYMATYNHERYISEAIEGVIAQRTDFPIELVIGEDCSTDGTREIVRKYQQRYPELIRMITGSHNVGMIANSNRCLPLCRGKYIAFCEGDDYWHHAEKLQMQVDAMSKSPNITLCHTDYDRKVGRIRKSGAHKRNLTRRLAKGNAYIDLLHEWTVKTATAVYRSDILRDFLKTEFNNPIWPFGDYNKLLYASVRGMIAYIPVSTATWRRVSGSATKSGYDRSLELGMAYAECREMFMRKYPVDARLARSIRRESKERIIRRAVYAGAPGVYEECYAWLVENGYKRGCIRHNLARWTMRNGALLSLVRAMEKSGAIDAFREVLRLLRTWAIRVGLKGQRA